MPNGLELELALPELGVALLNGLELGLRLPNGLELGLTLPNGLE